MLDIKFIIENPETVKKGAKRKGSKADIDKIIALYTERNELLQKAESLRARQNVQSKNIQNRSVAEAPNIDKNEQLLKEMTQLKKEIKTLQPQITALETQIDELAQTVPNPPLHNTPDGGEEDFEIVNTWGKKPQFDFTPKDHIELGKTLDIIDIERGAKTSGTRFYYLKNEAVMLEFALIQHVSHKLISKGFQPIIPPVLVKEHAMFATGFFPADRNEIYQVDDMFLVGTSEVPLTMLHADEIVDNAKLPLKYCGFSTCFRREAGSYGKDTSGILRVHQFNKLEMFIFCHPEKSQELHETIRQIEEEIMQDLKLHYRVINIAAGDLGAPAAKKYDIEVWIPTQDKFRELTSCSNCTDFQARRSKIRFTGINEKTGKEEKTYVHTLNGTAFADTRTIIAILENYQNKDGTVTIPEILCPYMGGRTKIEPK
ncbi:serine--tRNA ligase [Candidatus Peregrinibacteria bacterium]|nr:serine--tRNA ligase [Candidatus Peregrinibacteria bacterium]